MPFFTCTSITAHHDVTLLRFFSEFFLAPPSPSCSLTRMRASVLDSSTRVPERSTHATNIPKALDEKPVSPRHRHRSDGRPHVPAGEHGETGRDTDTIRRNVRNSRGDEPIVSEASWVQRLRCAASAAAFSITATTLIIVGNSCIASTGGACAVGAAASLCAFAASVTAVASNCAGNNTITTIASHASQLCAALWALVAAIVGPISYAPLPEYPLEHQGLFKENVLSCHVLLA